MVQITSQATILKHSIIIDANNFSKGNLPVTSIIQPQRIFSVNKQIVIKKKGKLNIQTTKEVINQIKEALFT